MHIYLRHQKWLLYMFKFEFGKLYAPFAHWRLFEPEISSELVRLQHCLADILYIHKQLTRC